MDDSPVDIHAIAFCTKPAHLRKLSMRTRESSKNTYLDRLTVPKKLFRISEKYFFRIWKQ